MRWVMRVARFEEEAAGTEGAGASHRERRRELGDEQRGEEAGDGGGESGDGEGRIGDVRGGTGEP